MDDVDYLALLAADIAAEGGTVAAGKASLTITRYQGLDLEYPTEIRTTPQTFATYLASMTVPPAWRTGDPRSGGYALFCIHLDEEMTVLAGNPDIITVTAREMKIVRDRPYEPFAPPPGDYEWRD